MTEKDLISPKEYVQEFIEVLKIEIEELKKSKDNNIVLKNVTIKKEKYGSNLYRFDMDRPFSPLENVVYKLIVGTAKIQCDLISVEGNQIILKISQTVSFNQDIKLYIDRTALPEKLLQCFQDTLPESDQRYANAARLFNSQFRTNNQDVPNLSDYSQVNDYQKAAVVRSFQGDTIIWGPPGTGKTHTVAVAINEQIKQDKRFLLLSHANTAVDGAMEELADLLNNDPVYTQGHLVRMGVSQLEKYPMLSLDEIVRIKAEELNNQINELKAQKVPLEKNLTGYLHISSLRKQSLPKQDELTHKKQIYTQQDEEIKQYPIEVTRRNSLLFSLNAELSQLEKKTFQTERIKGKIKLIEQQIDENNAFAAQRCEEIERLKVQHKDLYSVISQLEHDTQSDEWEIQSALSCAGVAEPDLEKEIKELSKKIDAIDQQIKDLEHRIASLKKQVIEEASVIGATLSMTFMSNDLQTKKYDTLFIDEISMVPLLPMFFCNGLDKF